MIHHRDSEGTEERFRISDFGLWIRASVSGLLWSSLCLCGYSSFHAFAADAPIVVPLEGESFPAELVGIGADNSLTFQSSDGQSTDAKPSSPVVELKLEDLVRWGHPAEPRAQTLVLLADGSRLVTAPDWSGGAAVEVEGDKVLVRSTAWKDARLPRELVAGLVFSLREHVDDRRKLEDAIRDERGAKDVVLLTNKDRISGKLTKLARGSLVMEVDGRETKLPLSRMAGVQLADGCRPSAVGRRPELIVGMRDGSKLNARALLPDGDGVAVELASGMKLRGGAVEDVVALQGLGGEKFVYISDLEPAEYKHVPYLSISWPYERDRNVLGEPLTVGGKRYLKGVGMHSAARLTYRLDGKYRRFDTAAALDDSSRGRGSVTFGVYLLRDGKWKPAATSDVGGGDEPENVSVDVRGAEAITLVVDFADRGDELDHANWLDARLIAVSKP